MVLVGQHGTGLNVTSKRSCALLHWLRGLRLKAQQLELVTVCAGSVLAAHAGLLKGGRVTAHHQHLEELQATEPLCEVVGNRVFVGHAPVHRAAQMAGFTSDTQLRRAWLQFDLPGTPSKQAT